MTDELKINDEALHKRLEEKADLDRKKESVLKKELDVKSRRLDNELARFAENDKASEIANTVGYGSMMPEEVARIIKDSEDYIDAARERMQFIDDEFNKFVPFFRQNIILIGSQTGEGKSTTVANIVRSLMGQTNPKTGQRRRVLVITNEERPADVYNRITCLVKGWSYVGHDKFTDEQRNTFSQYIEAYAKTKLISVIYDDYAGAHGTTRTLEGVCRIFDDLIARKDYYDVVLIDYYQNISESRANPTLDQYKVQAAFAQRLDSYKNIYPAPIVLFAQLKPNSPEQNIPFKVRIEGTKAIINVATLCMEIVPNREESTTEWKVIKNRFNGESVNQTHITGYSAGRYVSRHDPQFIERVSKMKAAMDRADYDRAVNPVKVVEETTEEKKNEELPKP